MGQLQYIILLHLTFPPNINILTWRDFYHQVFGPQLQYVCALWAPL